MQNGLGNNPLLAALLVLLVFAPMLVLSDESARADTVSNAELKPPAEYRREIQFDAKKSASYTCLDPILPYTGTLVFRSKYEGDGESRSELNEEAEKQYRLMTDQIRSMEQAASRLSDDYVKGKSPKAKSCLISNLEQWAAQSALLDTEVNHIGEAVRKWLLAASGAAYLEVTQAKAPNEAASARSERIEHWFHRLALEVMNYYSDRPLERVNNHDYWAAWAVMVTAINLQDRAMFHWAVEQYAVAASQVDSQGYLPNELRRDSRALSYHNFALQPLVMVAIFGEANGEALSALNNHSLARLVDRVLRGIDKPEIFEQVTGSEQKVDGLREPWSLAWLEPYLSRYALPASSLLDVNALRAMKNSRLGGDLTWYFYTPAKPKKVRNLSIEPFVQE